MTVYQQGETWAITTEFREVDPPSSLTDPSSVSVTIYDPCGVALVEDAVMPSSATGKYYYNYAFTDTAFYGEYKATIKSIDADGVITKTVQNAIILPFDIIDSVRTLSGIGSSKSISDDDIAKMIFYALDVVNSDIYIKKNEVFNPGVNCTYGTIDGSNTEFSTREFPIADSNGDGDVSGWGEKSCGTDVSAYYIDEDDDYHWAYVTVVDEDFGTLTIKSADGVTALPASTKKLIVIYSPSVRRWTQATYESAIAYYSAHMCIKRFVALENATLADLDSNQARMLADMNRMLKMYQRHIRKLRHVPAGGI